MSKQKHSGIKKYYDALGKCDSLGKRNNVWSFDAYKCTNKKSRLGPAGSPKIRIIYGGMRAKYGVMQL